MRSLDLQHPKTNATFSLHKYSAPFLYKLLSLSGLTIIFSKYTLFCIEL